MAKSISFDPKSRAEHLLFPKKEGGTLLYYLLTTLLIFGLAALMIIVGGMLRLTLANLILALIGFNLIYWTIENTVESDIWKSEGKFDKRVNLKLKDTSELVERARSGMDLSQGVLEKKIRDLFLEKFKDERNLTNEEVRELIRNPEEFKKAVDDEIVADFILSKKEKSETPINGEDEQSSPEISEGEDYEKWITTLLERIERWE